jgi:hypothetical protein
VGFLIGDCCPGGIVGTPVIVERPKVIAKKEIIIKPKYDDETLNLFKSLRDKKSELLKKLKLGDNEARKKVITSHPKTLRSRITIQPSRIIARKFSR